MSNPYRSPLLSPEASDDEDLAYTESENDTHDESEEEEEEEKNMEAELVAQLQRLHAQLAKVRSGGGTHARKASGGVPNSSSSSSLASTDGAGTVGGSLGGMEGGGGEIKCPQFIDEKHKLIVCATRKPVVMSRSESGDAWEYIPSKSGFNTAIEYMSTSHSVQFVAWPGACVDEATQDAVKKRLMSEHRCSPVFVSKDIKERFETFCWHTLWPKMHCMATFFNEAPFQAAPNKANIEDNFNSGLEAFTYFNQKFVDRVAEIYEPGDLVLVHGYELMVLPAMLRKRYPEIKLGFFLHCPFPSSEYFRMIPARETLLTGVLGADLIAFNDYDYVRHFLHCCTCILGLQSTPSSMDYLGRKVTIEICPAGIDPEKLRPIIDPPLTAANLPSQGSNDHLPSVVSFSSFDQAAMSDLGSSASVVGSMGGGGGSGAEATTFDMVEQIRKRFQQNGKKLVVSLERLDWCKGIPQKLVAMDLFFQEFPEWRGKVTFFLAVRDLYGRRDKNLLKLVNTAVGKVNGKWGSTDYIPVHYLVRSLSDVEKVALYCAADVALVTSLREGINLSAMEFIACQSIFASYYSDTATSTDVAVAGPSFSPSPNPSAASNTAATGSYGALGAVGGTDATATSDASRPPPSKGVLIYSEFAGCASSLKGAYVVNPYDAMQVAEAINNGLGLRGQSKSVRHHQLNRYVSQYTSSLWAERILGAMVEAVSKNSVYNNLVNLDIGYLLTLYGRTSQRLLVFDYDGTLMPHNPLPPLCSPTPVLLNALKQLCQDPCNQVIVITGRRREDMEEWFIEIPQLGLITDYGYWIRLPNPPPHQNRSHRTPSGISPLPSPSSGVSAGFTVGTSRAIAVDGIGETSPPGSRHTSPRDAQGHAHAQAQAQAQAQHLIPPPLELPVGRISGGASPTADLQMCADPASLLPPQLHSVHLSSPVLSLSSTAIATSASLATPTPLAVAAMEASPRHSPQQGHVHTPDDGRSRLGSDDEAPVAPAVARPWLQMDRGEPIDLSWIGMALHIIEAYTECTPGSVIEKQDCCITWHFRDTDADFGQTQAQNLHLQLQQLCTNLNVRVSICQNYKYIVVQSNRVNKAKALGHMIDTLFGCRLRPNGDTSPSASPSSTFAVTCARRFDLVLCMNDDLIDEGIHNVWNKHSRPIQQAHGLFMVTTGGARTSRAKYYVDDSDEVLRIVKALAARTEGEG